MVTVKAWGILILGMALILGCQGEDHNMGSLRATSPTPSEIDKKVEDFGLSCSPKLPKGFSKLGPKKNCLVAEEVVSKDECHQSVSKNSPELGQGSSDRLCLGSTNTAPADCYTGKPQSLSSDEGVTYCTGAVTPQSPLDCFLHHPHGLTGAQIALLCSGSTSSAPVDCFYSTPGQVDTDNVVLLCSGTTSNFPWTCFSKAPQPLSDGQKALLCYGAKDLSPIDCFNEGSLAGLSQAEAVILCEGATSKDPVQCFSKLEDKVPRAEGLKICRRTVQSQ